MKKSFLTFIVFLAFGLSTKAQNCEPANLPWLQTLLQQTCDPFSCALHYYQADYNGSVVFYNDLNPICADFPVTVYKCDGTVFCQSGGFFPGDCPPNLFSEFTNIQQLPSPCGGCIDPSLINPTAICPLIYAPVCGCNGVTYDNDCLATNVGGVTSWTPGECGSSGGCIDPSLINPTAICPLIYAPVCGCNGVTYDNDCLATNVGGVTSWTPGECGSSGGCIDPSLINPTAICPLIYAPVCGCNGVTYDNDCLATNVGGVTSWTPGECGSSGGCIDPSLINPTAICPLIYAPVCGCNGVTYDNDCFATNAGGVTSWTPGECGSSNCINPAQIDSTQACPDIYMPVCGCNGVTYSNECEATYYGGVTAFTSGACNGGTCQAAFAISDSLGLFYFTDQSTSTASIAEWKWVIGDTVKQTQNATYYAGISPIAFQINVCLTITTTDGCTSTACDVFSPPSCYLYPNFTYTAQGKNVYFTDASVGLGGPTNYEWTFGDGGVISSLQNPIHVYANYGTYNVCLTISGGIQGCGSEQYCRQITIDPAQSLTTIAQQYNIRIYPSYLTETLQINYQLKNKEMVSIDLYDINGKLVRNITHTEQNAGTHNTQISQLSNLVSGIYLVPTKHS
jgi:PKD repeat protein